MEQAKAYKVPAVEKAFLILEYIINSTGGCSLKDIHSNLDIPKTSAYTILNTLIMGGLVHKTLDNLFIPTLKITAMGLKAREFNANTQLIRPLLEAFRDSVGFTVFFCMYDQGEQIVLEKLDGFSSVVFNAYVGQRKKLNTSGGGKAMAAFLSPQELNIVLDKGLDSPTVNSIYEKDAFIAHLAAIRAQGYAVDDNEGELGVRCIGAPVFMYGGRLYGAVSISALSDSLPLSAVSQYAKQLIDVTREISKNLGFTALMEPAGKPEGKPVGKPENKPAGKPAEKPAGKPESNG